VTSITIKATSTFDTGKSGTATVTVPQYTVTSVSISPSGSVFVAPGSTQQFSATVTGTNSPPQTVTWTIVGANHSGTTITTGGNLTVASGETAESFTVRATSTVDTNVYGETTVDVLVYKEVTVSGLSIPAQNDGNSIYNGGAAYGGGVFVIGGDSGKIFRSTDRGDSWTQVSDSKLDSSGVTTLAYGDSGIFVAGGKDGKIAYSEDMGVSWTLVGDSGFGSSNIANIRYLNNKFFAVGVSNKMAYSSDGKTWTSIACDFGTSVILDIAYGDNKFVAVGRGTPSYSTNGISGWTKVSGGSDIIGHCIVYAGGKFVVGETSTDLWYSVSGNSGWNIGVKNGHQFTGDLMMDIAYGDGKFIVVASRIAFSSDGESWDALSIFARYYKIVYGDGRFVIVGSGRVYIIGD
jgi:photosystem II stability/assembly factor-like uncharacterized protein